MRSSANLHNVVISFIAAVLAMDSGLAQEPSETLPQPHNSQPEVNQDKASGENDDNEVVRLTNKERDKYGLQTLEWCPDLAKAAQTHAQDMFLDGYFSHTSHDRVGGQLFQASSPQERLLSFSARACAENIAQGQNKPEEVIAGWMGSDSHRANILAKDYQLCGIGFAGGYWVQVFGR